jgi:hypothetical protein
LDTMSPGVGTHSPADSVFIQPFAFMPGSFMTLTTNPLLPKAMLSDQSSCSALLSALRACPKV